MRKYLLLLRSVLESVASVENAQVVGILHVAFSKAKRDSVLLGEEMQSIECFGLGFGNGWHVRGSRQAPIACESPPRVLDDQSLRGRLGLGLVVKQWSQCILVAPATETIHQSQQKLIAIKHSTHFSLAQGSARVRIKSGRVLASSLYTVHELDNLLSPPSAAVSRHAKAITSPESVWNTCLSVV